MRKRAKYRKYLNFNFKYKVFIAEFDFFKKILCDKWEGTGRGRGSSRLPVELGAQYGAQFQDL